MVSIPLFICYSSILRGTGAGQNLSYKVLEKGLMVNSSEELDFKGTQLQEERYFVQERKGEDEHLRGP